MRDVPMGNSVANDGDPTKTNSRQAKRSAERGDPTANGVARDGGRLPMDQIHPRRQAGDLDNGDEPVSGPNRARRW